MNHTNDFVEIQPDDLDDNNLTLKQTSEFQTPIQDTNLNNEMDTYLNNVFNLVNDIVDERIITFQNKNDLDILHDTICDTICDVVENNKKLDILKTELHNNNTKLNNNISYRDSENKKLVVLHDKLDILKTELHNNDTKLNNNISYRDSENKKIRKYIDHHIETDKLLLMMVFIYVHILYFIKL